MSALSLIKYSQQIMNSMTPYRSSKRGSSEEGNKLRSAAHFLWSHIAIPPSINQIRAEGNYGI